MARRRALLVPVLALAAAALSAQESDYINMGNPGRRALIFETPNAAMRYALDGMELVGDVDGDGVQELALVHSDDSVEEYRQTIYLLPGSSAWSARNTISPELPGVSRFWPVEAPAGVELGDVGDLNGDGFADLAFAATRYVLPEHAEGARGVLFIVYGEAGFDHSGTFGEIRDGVIPGTVIYDSSDPGGLMSPGGSGGVTVADVNGNGIADLVFAGYVAGSFDGVLNVLLDADELGPRADLKDLGDSLPGFSLTVSESPDHVAGVGDLDGDGFEELVLSGGDPPDGWIVVFYGRPDPEGVYDLAALGPEGGDFLVLHPPEKQDPGNLYFGQREQVAPIGDLDGDGYDDLLIGESYPGRNAPDGPALLPAIGRVHLLHGGPRLVGTIALDQITSERRRVIHGLESGFIRDEFGTSISSPGDINGDGLADILIGARRRSGFWEMAGEVYLIYGQAEFPEDLRIADGFHGIRLAGGYQRGGLGWFLGPAGDFDLDGNPDFFVVEPPLSFAEEPGRLYVVLGTGDGVPPLRLLGLEPPFGPQRGSLTEVVGSGFRGAVEVYLGTRRVLVHEASATRLRIEAPPSDALGLIDVRVVVDGVEVTLSGGYEYVPDFPQIDVLDLGDDGLVVETSGIANGGTALGDLTGDGIAELIAPGERASTWEVTIVEGGRGLPAAGEPFDEHTSVLIAELATETDIDRLVLVGDVNGDGFEDLAISLEEAEAYIVFGRSGFAPEMTIEEEILAGRAVEVSVFGGPGVNNKLELAPLDDVDGDGITDIAIGIPGEFAGEVVVVPGRREWPGFIDLSDPRSIIARLDGLAGATRLGTGLVALGDVNGDGTTDLLSSARALEDADASPAFFIPVVPPLILDPEAVVRIEVEHAPGTGTLSRIHVAPAGDTNGDGRADFILGYEGGGLAIQGSTFLVREAPSGSLLRIEDTPAEPDGIVRIYGEPTSQSSQATGIGDLNGDGLDDLAVRAFSAPFVAGSTYGVAAVIFGDEELPPRIELSELRAYGLRFESEPITIFQMSTPNSGDLNGDGRPDFALRETRFESQGTSQQVYVIYSPYREATFRRGDANRDGRIDISDGTYILTFLFLGGARPPCEDAADADDLGSIELTDGVYLLNHLFLGGPPPPPPYPGEGADGTADGLGCVGF